MRARRSGTVMVSAGVIAQLLFLGSDRARAAEPVTVTYEFTGAEQQFEVPDNITTIHVVLVGADGGSTTSRSGGRGARVEGDLDVVPGTVLHIEVGGRGNDHRPTSAPGGFNGGGAGGSCGTVSWADGGGASDIRLVARDQAGSLDSRLIVAAGGGGAGGTGIGGDAGQPGAGGALSGREGTATAGGAGGTGLFSGQAGAFGAGGAGAGGNFCGSGGAGGYYGGGGGGVDSNGFGGAGGGGSSYTGNAASASIAIDETYGDHGAVAITYVPVSGSGTVAAEVTVPTSAACLELSTTAIDFGTLPLGSEDQSATSDIVVTNCSGASETVFARGTDATATAAGWTLDDSAATCADSLGVDAYHLDVASETTVRLSTSNKEVGVLGSGAQATHIARISTACPGSTGAGRVMTMQIVYVAAE